MKCGVIPTMKLKGITVTLYEAQQTGVDGFGASIYEEVPVPVENVLVAPSSQNEILDATNLYGRKAIYTLGIPKGDAHQWENRKVSFFGQDWRAFGIPLQGQDELIPLAWNKKVMVERYE